MKAKKEGDLLNSSNVSKGWIHKRNIIFNFTILKDFCITNMHFDIKKVNIYISMYM